MGIFLRAYQELQREIVSFKMPIIINISYSTMSFSDKERVVHVRSIDLLFKIKMKNSIIFPVKERLQDLD